MGFLDKIFGPKPKQAVTLKLNDVPGFMQKQVSHQQEQLGKTVASKFSEIKHLLSELQNSLQELESAAIEEENKRLERIVKTSRNQVIRQMNPLLQKLTPPQSRDLNEMRNYCLDSAEILEKEIRTFGKNIAYTGILLKEKIKKLGSSVKELNSIFLDLKNEFNSSSSIFLAPEAEELTKLITEKQSNIESLKKNVSNLQSSINSLQKKKDSLNKELNELKTGSEFEELDAIRGKKSALLREKQQLKSNLINLLSAVEKPLKKFEKLVKKTEIQLGAEKRSMLSEYITNPFFAFRKDPKAEILKQILSELKNAIIENKIAMKEKEREKRLSALEELLQFDFFENVFWKLNKVEAEFLALEKEEKEKEIMGKVAKKEAELSEVDREIQEKGSEMNSSKDRIEKEEESIAMIKENLREMLEQISQQQVTLAL